MNFEPQIISSSLPFISLFEDDESRWQAVVARNTNADGFFVYGVKTTKIFCRPICKARLARRANVTFYPSGQEAQCAGFRACKRCKPELAGFMPEELAVQKIRGFVRDSAAAAGGGDEGQMKLSLSQMARQTGLSKWHFYRVFKKCVGVTPTEYLREQRARKGQDDRVPGDQFSWLDNLDFAALDSGLDSSFWHDPVLGSGELSTDASSATVSESSPWSLDDFVVWPEA